MPTDNSQPNLSSTAQQNASRESQQPQQPSSSNALAAPTKRDLISWWKQFKWNPKKDEDKGKSALDFYKSLVLPGSIGASLVTCPKGARYFFFQIALPWFLLIRLFLLTAHC